MMFDESTWVISDTHYFHANIALYCGRPDDWQEQTIANWQALVQPHDKILHLGDLALGKKEQIVELMPALPGQIFMIRGNHDWRNWQFYNDLGITLVIDPYQQRIGDRLILFSHRPIVPTYKPNIHGHVHNNDTPHLSTLHINASLDMMDWKPVRLGWLLKSRLLISQA